MKKFAKKTLKFLVTVTVGIIITVNAFILLSGRVYLYKGIANTYLKGRTGPSIYDLETFPVSEVKRGETEDVFDQHSKYNTGKIPSDLREYIEDLDTRALLIVQNDSLIYEEYWEDHEETTLSNSFSIAKTVVALLVGIAIEEGHIESLDTEIWKYIPEFKDGGRDKITVRHLLQMASGLSWTESGANPLSDNAESYYGTNLDGLVKRQKQVEEPGTRWNYQSGNSQLLAMIVEKATGMTVSKYAEEKIWKKIGMQDNAYWSLDKEGGQEKAFCCLYATARDFAKIGRLLLHQGKYKEEQIIPRWYFLQMTKAYDELTTDDGVPNYRYGLHIWTYRGGANEVFYCRGIKGQYIIAIPDQDLLIIRLGKKRKPDFEIPSHLKNDQEYIQANRHAIGHCLGVFQYISLGKMIASQTKL